MGVGELLMFLLWVISVLDPYLPSLAIVALVFGCFECGCNDSDLRHRSSLSNALQICVLDSSGPINFASRSGVRV